MEALFMTTKEFAEYAKRKDAVAILPLGSVEGHSDHLVLGTDSLLSYKLICMAAEKEEALVYPVMPYTFTARTMTFPGTLTLAAETLLSVLEQICDEISRNGIKKIIIHSGHGGNFSLLDLFRRNILRKNKDYVVFFAGYQREPFEFLYDIVEKEWPGLLETGEYGHAGPIETSMMLYLYGEKGVREDEIKMAKPMKKLNFGIAQVYAGWGVTNPDQLLGDPRKAHREKGRRLVEAWVERFAETIKKVKEANVELARTKREETSS